MRHALVLGVLILVACQPKPAINLPTVATTSPIPAPAPKPVVVVIPSDPIAAVAVLPPKQLKAAASKTLKDADNYVAWSMSRRENIDILTNLTAQLTDALSIMAEGHNQAKDVANARKALKALRVFLVTKGD